MKTSRLITSLFSISILCFATRSAFAQDDHGDDASTATPVAIPSVTAGNIQEAGDTDWFSFSVNEGSEITLETELVSLMDTTLTLFAPDGMTELAFDDDGGQDLASRITWIAPSSDTYYSKVASFDGLTGAYNFLINPVPEPSGIGLAMLALPIVLGIGRRRV